MNFKDQIEYELSKQSWDVVLVDTISKWWEDEHWEIQWKHSKGLKLYIQFLEDIGLTDSRYYVRALKSKKDINILFENPSEIVMLCINKRKLDAKLKAFVSDIETYRLTL